LQFVVGKVHELLQPFPEEIITYRMIMATMLFLDALVRIDEKVAALDGEAMISEALNLATTVVTAPYPNNYKPLRSPTQKKA